MVAKKFRVARQRHWGSWVSEIRHPLLKRRVWLGTSDTAEEAARAYDQPSILINGRNAKTNFPVTLNSEGTQYSSPSSSEILRDQLRRCGKTPSPSFICLRLDTESSQIGVWQKRAGPGSDSKWVMTVQLENKKKTIANVREGDQLASPNSLGPKVNGEMDEEDRIALQMLEELLQSNDPN